MILQTCPRCGNRTAGTREGDTEYCTCCGGALGPATTAEADDYEQWRAEELADFNAMGRQIQDSGKIIEVDREPK